MGAFISIVFQLCLLGFVVVMLYRLVRASERIAEKLEEGITVNNKNTVV